MKIMQVLERKTLSNLYYIGTECEGGRRPEDPAQDCSKYSSGWL